MKKGISTLLILMAATALIPFKLSAATVEVSWSANSESDLAGYKVYYGTQSGTYTSTINVGNVTKTDVGNLETGRTYYFAMTAYDTSANESERSNEASIAIPVPDTTPPTGSISINAGAAKASSRSVVLSLSAADTQGTIAGMKISNDGVTWSDEAPFAASQAWALTSGDGTKTVYALFKDNSGNWMTAPASDTIEFVQDTDGDGMPDAWEVTFGFNVNDPSDAGQDSDSDGYNNLEEFTLNSNPTYRYDFAPIVEAGANQQSDPTRIFLDGSASRDPNGDTITYAWSQLSGPAVAIENASASKASFLGVTAGTYSFKLSCADAKSTSTDTVSVVVNNVAPSVNAGSDMTINAGQNVTLHAAGSDPNNDKLSYAWSLAEGPAISLPAMNTQDITLTPLKAGNYKFNLTCSDGANISQADQMILTVNAVNQAPTANAGSDIEAQIGTVVTLDGTASSDPDNDMLTYTWTQVSGTAVSLDKPTSPQPQFNATATGQYAFELKVSDGKISSVPDTVTVQVLKHNTSPVAIACDDISTKVGSIVALDAVSSYDPDNDQLSYAWSQTKGASVEMNSSNTSSMTFTPTVSGVLEFKVVVSDGQAQSEDTVSVSVESVNHVPVAEAGNPQTITLTPVLGQKVTLDGSSSYDSDNDTLSYIWSQTAGSNISLSNPNTANPSFIPSAAGIYTFELKVFDGKDTSIADTVSITVLNQQANVELSQPANGAQISENPVFKWTGTNMSKYSMYIALDGKTFIKTYSGKSSTFSFHPVLWYWFIPKSTTVSWYIVGEGDGKQTKSLSFSFKKK